MAIFQAFRGSFCFSFCCLRHFVSYRYTSLITAIHKNSAGRPGKSQQTCSSAVFALSNNKEKTIDLSLRFLFTITIVLHRRHLIVLLLEPESTFPLAAYLNRALASFRDVSRMPLFPSSSSHPTPSIRTTDPRHLAPLQSTTTPPPPTAR